MEILKFACYCMIILLCIYPIVNRICDSYDRKYMSKFYVVKAIAEALAKSLAADKKEK